MQAALNEIDRDASAIPIEKRGGEVLEQVNDVFNLMAMKIKMAQDARLQNAERFGMETRTELILLQRTMVVVEGVLETKGIANRQLPVLGKALQGLLAFLICIMIYLALTFEPKKVLTQSFT